MAVVTVRRGKKRYLTSSYFDDIKATVYEQKKELDYFGMKKNNPEMLAKLQQSWVLMEFDLWKKGCHELSEHVKNMTDAQVAQYDGTIYMGLDADAQPVEGDKAVELTEENVKKILDGTSK